MGSDFLWSRLQQLQPHLHVFGHTHFAWDMQLAGGLGFDETLDRGAVRLTHMMQARLVCSTRFDSTKLQ